MAPIDCTNDAFDATHPLESGRDCSLFTGRWPGDERMPKGAKGGKYLKDGLVFR